MALIAKRKLKSALGAIGDGGAISNLIQHIQSLGGTVSNFTDNLTVNRLTVKHRLRIPCGTDMYD